MKPDDIGTIPVVFTFNKEDIPMYDQILTDGKPTFTIDKVECDNRQENGCPHVISTLSVPAKCPHVYTSPACS